MKCIEIKSDLRVNNCEDVMYLILGLIQLMGLIQKPSVRTRFTRDHILETSLFAELV
jgi:hypothetical protein